MPSAVTKTSAGFFYESAAEAAKSGYEPQKSSFLQRQTGGGDASFNEHFEKLYNQYYQENGQLDIKKDVKRMVKDPIFMSEYKSALMDPVFQGFRAASENDPHIESIIESVSQLWDNGLRFYNESVQDFLPVSTLEFPVLVKQFFSSIMKDIIEVEAIKSPSITKHVRTTYLVDNNTMQEYEYPKCMFDGTWTKINDAARGHKIREDVVPLNNGRLWKYDIVTNCTNGTSGLDRIAWDFKIIGVQVGSEVVRIPGNGIVVELSTGGTLLNGNLNFTSNGIHVEDVISGQVDYTHGTIDLSTASGQVTGVVFSGHLSNEKNMRNVSVREKRSILNFKVSDGPRWNMPFTIEEIEDAAALLDINYYNRMADECVRTMDMNECMTVIKFLMDQHEQMLGVDSDTWNLEPTSINSYVDLVPADYYSGDPFKFKTSAIQYRLRALIQQIADMTKLEGLSYVIVGNPMAVSLLSEFTEWKMQQGSNVGGIRVNGSYGFATDLGANVRVVASNLYDAYTVDAVEETGKRELIIHVYAYPTDAEHISFRHLKYTSHIFQSQNQTAYQSLQAPNGAYNILTAVSRYDDIAIQGISADLIFLHSETVYGPAPKRPPVMGGPWPEVNQQTPSTPPTPPEVVPPVGP